MGSDVRANYNRDGFAVAEGFFDAARVNSMLAEIDRIIARCTGSEGHLPDNSLTLSDRLEKEDYDALDYSNRVGFHFDEIRRDDGTTAIVPRSIINLFLSGGVFHDLPFDPRLLDLIQEVTGPEIRFFNSRCFLKPPGGLGTKWHRDIEFFDCEPNPIINCIVVLEEMSRDNGGLKVVPGSHWSQRRGKLDLKQEFCITSQDPFCSVPGEVYVMCPAGSVILLDHFCLHGSETNHSDQSRRILSLGFAGPLVKTLAGEFVANVLARGKRKSGEIAKEGQP